MVKPSSTCPKGPRRKIDSAPIRNAMCQVPTFLVTSFVEEHYEKPKNIPQDSHHADSITKKVTGQQIKPTHSF